MRRGLGLGLLLLAIGLPAHAGQLESSADAAARRNWEQAAPSGMLGNPRQERLGGGLYEAPAGGSDGPVYRQLETTGEAQERIGAERYGAYRDNGYSAPLGGYDDPLGDPAPAGALSPGYADPYGEGLGY